MDPTHLNELCEAFDLGKPTSCIENTEGVLNRNYDLVTDRGSYFIKSVREKRRDSIKYIAAVETFMAEGAIPAIQLLKTKSGSEYFEYGTELYTVYPYLDNTKESTEYDYAALGALLARIHVRGGASRPQILETKRITEKEAGHALERLTFFRSKALEGSEPVDVLFLTYIDMKLQLLPHLPDVAYEASTLIHGDYHLGNLLFSEKGLIIGVCDWEKADLSPRAYEIARSIQYICFENRRPPFSYDRQKAIDAGRQFLKGYRAEFPIDAQELKSGFDVRFRKLVATFWIEDMYYVQNDSRANHFLSNEIKLLNEFSTSDTVHSLVF